MDDMTAAELAGRIPREVRGWTAVEDHAYDRETIFDYIDGAGEVYRAFGMRLVVSRRFERPGEPDIVADLFDMGSPADAFGVFAHDLEGEPWGIGQESLYKSGLLQFWRGRLFASIFAERETAEAVAALAELGRAVAAASGPDGPKPDLIGLLPEEWRSGRVRYVHDPQILNYHFFLARENLLGLGPGVEAAIATTGEKDERRTLLLVRYPGPDAAAAAERSFLQGYVPETMSPETARERAAGRVRLPQGRWAAAARSGAILGLVFGAASAAEAKGLLDRGLAASGR